MSARPAWPCNVRPCPHHMMGEGVVDRGERGKRERHDLAWGRPVLEHQDSTPPSCMRRTMICLLTDHTTHGHGPSCAGFSTVPHSAWSALGSDGRTTCPCYRWQTSVVQGAGSGTSARPATWLQALPRYQNCPVPRVFDGAPPFPPLAPGCRFAPSSMSAVAWRASSCSTSSWLGRLGNAPAR